MPRDGPGPWPRAFLVVAVTVLHALSLAGLRRGDDAGFYATASSLVSRGSLAIDGYIGAVAPAPCAADAPASAYGSIAYAGGHFYHAAPIGPAILAAPFVALGRAVAPLTNPHAPLTLFLLVSPLAAGLVAWTVLSLARHAGMTRLAGLLLVAATVLLLQPIASCSMAATIAVLLILGAVVSLLELEQPGVHVARASITGIALGALAFVDTGAAAVAGALAGAALWALRRKPIAAASLLVGWLGTIVLAVRAETWLGVEHSPLSLHAVDPAARAAWFPMRPAVCDAAVVALALAGTALGASAQRTRSPARAGALAAILLLGCGWISLRLTAATPSVLVASRWSLPLVLVPLGAATACGAALWSWLRTARRPYSWASLAVATLGIIAASAHRAPPQASVSFQDYAPPFSMHTANGGSRLWALRGKAKLIGPSALRLSGGQAISPWIEATPGLAYRVRVTASQPLRVAFSWSDAARIERARQTRLVSKQTDWQAEAAAPVGAAGLYLVLQAGDARAAIDGIRVEIAAGTRIEGLPDYAKAALAFTFDWESAMGGLIHARANNSAGEPSVAWAEKKGLEMRDGAKLLRSLFERHGIRATFYATGYDLLTENVSCRRFVGDPIYERAVGSWHSTYWASHRWYGHDPCSNEEAAPAWYFGSLTREIAAAGHEIGCHTFGHMYVAGLSTEQLGADLAEWTRAARALGIRTAPSFAFPYTSRPHTIVAQARVVRDFGFTVLTRLRSQRSLELTPFPTDPSLVVFPDQQVRPSRRSRTFALRTIDRVLASRGYASLWAHPSDVVEGEEPDGWAELVEYASARRAEGLWVAPLTEIALYGKAARDVVVSAVPLANAERLVVEKVSAAPLRGVTLGMAKPVTGLAVDAANAAPEARGNQLRFDTLGADPVAVTVLE